MTPRPAHAVIAACFAALVGCSSPALAPISRSERGTPGPALKESAAPAMPEPVVDTLVVTGPGLWAIPLQRLGELSPGQRIRVTFEDSRTDEATVALFRPNPLPGDVASSPGRRWLGATRWRVDERARIASDSALPALLLTVPEDARPGWAWVGGRRVRLERIEPRGEISPAAAMDAATFARLNPALEDARLRWRALLARGYLGAAGERAIDDPEAAAVSASLEALWYSALGRVSELDPRAATVLAEALAPMTEITPGITAPVWPSSIAPGSEWFTLEESRLLRKLLSADATPGTLLRDANDFIAGVPTAGVRIVGISREGGLRLRVSNLTGAPITMTSASAVGAEPIVIDRQRSGAFLAPLEGAMSGDLLVDRRMYTRSLADVQFVSLPPGGQIGPLRPPMSMAFWRRVATASEAPRRALLRSPACVGRLIQDSPGRWIVYLEATPAEARTESSPAGPLTPAQGQPGSIDLWLRDADGGDLVISLAPGGAWWIRDSMDRPRPEVQLEPPIISAGPDGTWRYWVVLPEIATGDHVEMAVTYTLPDASVAAWPIAMTPWDRAPVMARFDLKAWDGLGDDFTP